MSISRRKNRRTGREKIWAYVTKALRWKIEESRETSGRSMHEEVEARLRASFRLKHNDGLVLVRLDDGLKAHLEAYNRAMFNEDLEDTIIYIIRNWVLKELPKDYYLREVIPKLPEPYRTSCMDMPIYRQVVLGEKRK